MANPDQLPQSILNKVSADKFLLIFDLPPALKSLNTNNTLSDSSISRDSVQYSIQGTIVPDIIVPSLTLPYAGQSLKVSSHAREPYEDISVTFTIDNRFKNWMTIYKWLSLMNDEKLSLFNQGTEQNNTDYMDKYQTTFNIWLLDEYNQQIMKFNYTKCFPTHLDKINYNYQDPLEIKSGFTFSFSQFLAEECE